MPEFRPRPYIFCHHCGDRIYHYDLGLVIWRFHAPRQHLASAAVVHESCRNRSAFPYHATLKDFIGLQPLFQTYFNLSIREGEMTRASIWCVLKRIFCIRDDRDRDAYFDESTPEDLPETASEEPATTPIEPFRRKRA